MSVKLPFWMIPSHWGHSPDDLKIKYIEYYYEGKEKDLKLLDLKNLSKKDKDIELLKIKKKYQDISDYEYDIEMINILHEDKTFDKQSKILNVEKQYDRITSYEYENLLNDLSFSKDKITKIEYDEEILSIKLKYNKILIDEYEKLLLEQDRKNKRISSKEYEIKLLDIDLKYSNITNEEYDYSKNNLEHTVDSISWNQNKLLLDLKYKKITQAQYNKMSATLNEQPYFEIIDSGFVVNKNPGEEESKGFKFELDYNEYFVNQLREDGWLGATDQQVVDEYFKDICRQIAAEEELFDTGGFGPGLNEYEMSDGTYKIS